MSVSNRTVSGPRLRVVASCNGCQHVRSESYRVQGDSGTNVFCDHPRATERVVGDTTWDTPKWCPEFSAALREVGMDKVDVQAALHYAKGVLR